MTMIASYETPRRPPTPDTIALHGAAPQPARAAMAVEWQGAGVAATEAALAEAANAYDDVIRQTLAAHIAAIKAAR
jgi:hypothetical protein